MNLITFNWCTKQIMEMKKRPTPKLFFFHFFLVGAQPTWAIYKYFNVFFALVPAALKLCQLLKYKILLQNWRHEVLVSA